MLLVTNSVISVLLVMVLVPLFIRWSVPLGLMKEHKPLPGADHTRTVPLVGGTVIFLVWILTFVVSDAICEAGFPFDELQARGLLIGALVVYLMGLKDDLGELDYKLRLVIQIAAALVLVAHGFHLDIVTIPYMGTIKVGWWGHIIVVLWVVLVTNAINLIDGLDGLAASIAAIALFFIGLLALKSNLYMSYLTISLAIIFVAYLRYAWYPAKTFLGNSGSFLMGFLLAVFSLKASVKGTTLLSLFFPLIIMSVPLLDLVRLFLSRSLRGRNPFRSDGAHLHYLLLEGGFRHPEAVGLICLFSFFFASLGFLVTLIDPEATLVIFVVILAAFLILYKTVGLLRRGQ